MFQHCFSRVRCVTCTSNYAADLVWALPTVQAGNFATSTRRFCGLFCCRSCRGPVIIEFELKGDSLGYDPTAVLNRISLPMTHKPALGPTAETHLQGKVIVHASGPLQLEAYATIIRVYDAEVAEPPAHLPAAIEVTWRDELHVAASPRHRVFTCRMLIEQMCKDKGGTGKNLEAQIDSIAQLLSPAVIEWAHTIRLLGNTAVHEAETPIDIAESMELMEFTRTIAEMLYSVPTRIAELRKANDDRKAAAKGKGK